MVWVNKRLLWITKQQHRHSQHLSSVLILVGNVFGGLGSFKLSCYLPIFYNSYKIIITWITVWCCHESSANLLLALFSTVAAWISSFINKLFCYRFIPFWMNIMKKKLYQPSIFLYFYNSFMGETPLNTHEKMIAVPRFRNNTVFH